MNANVKTWKLLWMVLPVLAGIAFLIAPLEAAEFREAENTVIAAGEVIDDDLFAVGQTVVVDGTVNGDLFAAGQSVTINGAVNGNVIMGGGELILDGDVSGNVYSGGYGLTLGNGAQIDRSLYAGGYSIMSKVESSVGRTAHIGGYQAILDGNIVRDLAVGLGALELNGSVGGDVNGEVGNSEGQAPNMNQFMGPQAQELPEIETVNPGLRVSDGATVGGDLNVKESASPAEEAALKEAEEAKSNTFLSRLTPRLGELIAMLAVGALVIWRKPSWFGRFNNIVPNRTLASLGWGALWTFLSPFILLISVAVLFLLSMLTGWLSFGRLSETVMGVGGTGLAFAGSLFVFALRLLAPMFVLTTLGNWVLGKIMGGSKNTMSFGRLFGSLVLGGITLQLIRMIPYAGGWISFLISVIGIGALYLLLKGRNEPYSDVMDAPDHLKERMAAA